MVLLIYCGQELVLPSANCRGYCFCPSQSTAGNPSIPSHGKQDKKSQKFLGWMSAHHPMRCLCHRAWAAISFPLQGEASCPWDGGLGSSSPRWHVPWITGVLHALSCSGRDLGGRMGAFQRLEAGEVMPSPVWEFFLSLGMSSNIFPRKDGLARGGGTLSPTVVSRRA